MQTVDSVHYLRVVFVLLILGFIANGLWYAILIFIDCKKRDIQNKMKWVLLGLFLNTWGYSIYISLTGKPQTMTSISAGGVLLSKQRKQHDQSHRTQKVILSLVLLMSLLALSPELIYIFKNGLNPFLTNPQSRTFDLVSVLGIVYAIVGFFHIGKMNPLDKPLWAWIIP